MYAPTEIELTNSLLRKISIGDTQPSLLFLTGSSGSGKTHLCEALSSQIDCSRAIVHHFDRIGIPSREQMFAEFGSGEAWQKAKTKEWVDRLIAIRDRVLVIFEGQYNPHFAVDALRKLGVESWIIAVVTCDQDVWEQRLRGPRAQGILVTDDMRNWARVLRNETQKLGGAVIDTSASDLHANLNDVARLINPLLEKQIAR